VIQLLNELAETTAAAWLVCKGVIHGKCSSQVERHRVLGGCTDVPNI
jgi:hypothetical protein